MQADVIDVELGSLGVALEHRPDGAMLVRSTETLTRYPDKLIERLEHWAEHAPSRLFLAQRTPAGSWRELTYGEALAQVRQISSALAARDLSVERPLAILSGNDIEHALISLAAMDLGIPVAPISALKFARPSDPNGGFIFDGRISEDFRLATSTWVSVGPIRIRLISALAPFAHDAVIAGHDRDEVTALIFPEIPACRDFLGKAAESQSDVEVLANSHLRVTIEERLSALASQINGSSTRFARVLLMAAPASIDANEITDKGSLNQRAVLERHADLVAYLYANPPRPRRDLGALTEPLP